MEENIVERGENAGYHCFDKAFSLTLSYIYTHFNTLKKKLQENIVEKDENAQNEKFHLFPQCFLCNVYLETLY